MLIENYFTPAMKKITVVYLSCLVSIFFAHYAQASGMKLETSVVVVNTEEGEGVMTLKNTDPSPVLLYSSVENLPGDKEESLIVTPPVVRVNPGDSQTVRFMLKTPAKAVEQFKRAIFEGIPASDKTADKLQITLRQNVPLIIHPAGLKENAEPWTLLKWEQTGQDTLKVTNTGAYVIRMSPSISVEPQKVSGSLPRSYLLPGDTISVKLNNKVADIQKVTITPANLYGYFVKPYEASVSH
ncbi:fimbria/pilus chaperone family protein [Hafnia alvei]|uniref:fimbria/pilus chaperone family protein n=1 Tax=Hafnia alvei TaxID=569 RepID=UPI00187D512D|nr:fimbria/pilus chaperone family protein [Hafnia alvei]